MINTTLSREESLSPDIFINLFTSLGLENKCKTLEATQLKQQLNCNESVADVMLCRQM